MNRINCLFLFFTLITLPVFGQTGIIEGKITDHKTGETIIGANVFLEGTTIGASSDLDGNFQIGSIKPGVYNLIVKYISYKDQVIQSIQVDAGKKVSLSISLVEDVAELAEVVVTAKREISTDANLINEIKSAKLVVSGISAEQIVRMPDRDAAQVMQRMAGVTIADNRFVLVRGVPERYNQVMINRMIGPSTEIDKRSFSFDLIPSGTIDQMLVFKSGGSDLPGDFAGGVIQLFTKAPSRESGMTFGLNFGIRSNTTFGDYIQSQGSETDLFGFDNGFRDLPKFFPATGILKSSSRVSGIRERAGKSLYNNFGNTAKLAPMDMGFNFTKTSYFTAGGIKFSNLTSLAYSNSYQHYSSSFLRYNSFNANSAEKRFEYEDQFYSNDVRVNAMHNWNIELNEKNRIEFKNLFVQLGENETTIRSGTDFIQRPGDDLKNYAYHYLSRGIYSGQLEGIHEFGTNGQSKLTWMAGTNMINRNEPDYRRFRTFRDKTQAGTEAPYSMQLPPNGNLFETGRFWSDLKDRGYAHGMNFETRLKSVSAEKGIVLKTGYYAEYKTRSFKARYLNYLYPGLFDQTIGESLRKLPLDQIFSSGNINNEAGFVIEEGTTNQDSYTGTNLLGAGYVNATLPLGKFNVNAGFRGEYNVQRISALSNNGQPIRVNNPVFAPMPFLNTSYNLTDRSLLRIAYSSTVNRPEFRELAPFLYYQFEYEAGLYGNANLKTATIQNIDARWEFYPDRGEMITLGTFAKTFSNPIETYLQITSETPQLYFGNAQSAYTYGIELEVKKSFSFMGLSRLARNTSMNLNAAWIQSQVNVGSQASNQSQYRPLQGQSPYIINMGLYYFDSESGWTINTAYNVFGPRIFSVGDKLFPSWWEMPRQSLDLQVARRWMSGRLETKINFQNILNAPYRIFQDNNSDNKISRGEAVIQRYQVGTLCTLGLNWKINSR